MSDQALSQNDQERKRVIVVLLPMVHLLDLAGAIQSLSEANGFGAGYEFSYCAMDREVRTAQGLVLADLKPFPEPLGEDLVIVPGMDSRAIGSLRAVPTSWLRQAAAAGARIASVCSGAFVLGRAGLLDGRICTTHWKVVDRLQRDCPAARVVTNKLYVRDGNIITSAGIASGIDMALSLVEEDHGPRMVAKVAREMVVYLRREGEREQISVYLEYRSHLNPGVHQVQDWVIAHPDQKPTLALLSSLAHMSPRNLSRAFRRATGITPKAFASKVKIQVARDLLRNPGLTIDSIAASCGFDDGRQLRRLWKRNFGITVAEWRRGDGETGDTSCA